MAHICIILPTRNAAATLARAIACFDAQDHDDKSLILVDSASTDGTHDLIAAFAQRPDITWVNKPERGLAHAINLGVAQMPKDAIFGYLGADDFLEAGVLRTVSAHFEANPDDIGLFFDSYTARDGRDPVYRTCPAKTFSMANLLRHRTIAGMQNTFLRGDVIKANPFDERAAFAMDYELYLRLARQGLGERIVHSAQASTTNTDSGTISRTHKRASKREALAWALHYAPPGRDRRQAWWKYLKYRFV
ncbi:MAG: glycosyltransferase [Pseudomonadota bacterium]|mgnify:CR=1 FL=1